MFKYYASAIQNYVNFIGRANRPEFWWFQLTNFIITVIVGVIGAALTTHGEVSLLSSIYGLFIFLPSLAIGARRLRDAGFSPWWLLISLVPLVGIIVLIVMWCQPSK